MRPRLQVASAASVQRVQAQVSSARRVCFCFDSDIALTQTIRLLYEYEHSSGESARAHSISIPFHSIPFHSIPFQCFAFMQRLIYSARSCRPQLMPTPRPLISCRSALRALRALCVAQRVVLHAAQPRRVARAPLIGAPPAAAAAASCLYELLAVRTRCSSARPITSSTARRLQLQLQLQLCRCSSRIVTFPTSDFLRSRL